MGCCMRLCRAALPARMVNYDPSFAPVPFVLQVTRPVPAKSVLEAGRYAWIHPRPCPILSQQGTNGSGTEHYQ